MDQANPFKWRPFEGEIIWVCVRWYVRYGLSYRDLEEMMVERGLRVDHTTIYRWVQDYAPELEKRTKPRLKLTNDSWKVDETYIKVKGEWVYLYRAVDSGRQYARISAQHSARCRCRSSLFRENVGRAAYGRAACDPC